MKVTLSHGRTGHGDQGETVDLDDITAANLIKNGAALPATAPPPEDPSTDAEKPVTTPKKEASHGR